MAAEQPPAGRKGGVKLPGSPAVWIGFFVVALGAGAWILYKRSQSSSAASTAATASPTSAADTSTTDPSALGTLQTEIGDLQSSESDQQVQVPNVVGMTQERANAVVTAAGLRPMGAAVEPGKTLTVTAQSPAAGALVKQGSVVSFQASVKPPPKPAPKPKPKEPPKKKAA